MVLELEWLWLLINIKILELHYVIILKSTKLSRQHNNANVMAMGARLIKKNVAIKCVNTFLKTNFDGGRHLKKNKKNINYYGKLNKYMSILSKFF